MRRLGLSMVILAVLVALVAPSVAAVEPGDEAATAIQVSAGTATYDSSAMTTSATDPAACDPFPGPLFNTMWFSYRPARNGMTMVDVNSFVSSDGSTDYLATGFVFRVQGTTRTLLGCGAYPATVFMSATAGTTYLIMVAGLSTAATEEPDLSDRGGTFDLTIDPIKGRVLNDHFHDADSFVDEDSCSEPMTVSWDDNGHFKTFLGGDGVRRFTTFFQGTTTFESGGSSLVLRYAQTFTDLLNGSGVITGLSQDVSLDGEHVIRDVGRLVFDFETGEVTFDAGRHPLWYEGLDICAQLGI